MTTQRKLKLSAKVVLVHCILAAIILNISSTATIALVGATRAKTQAAATLSGVVTDASGAQLGDAIISLYSADRVLQVKSDGKGDFRFTDVPPGEYELEAARPGFKTKRTTVIKITGHNEPLSISLDIAKMGECGNTDRVSYVSTAGRTLTGVVLDSEQPIEGARVDLVRSFGTGVLASGWSNSQGEFTITNLETGQYYLRVSHAGYRDKRTDVFWIARETTTQVKVDIIKEGLIRVCQ